MKKISAVILIVLSFVLFLTGIKGKDDVSDYEFDYISGFITKFKCESVSIKSAFERIEIEVDGQHNFYFYDISCATVKQKLNLKENFQFHVHENKVYEIKNSTVTLFTKEQSLKSEKEGLNEMVLLGFLFLCLGLYEAYRGWFKRTGN